ncbi:keratin, type I cytoskeletal 18 isoform X1 [Gouania willdenowi]|nr:keratin-like protein KRT222 isoform X1 [Gouania willdenowi]XP_028308045.1 keratin-like protein KRT222 isoform X1 [Gouania willdenowi]XP_028308127.1 keratin-like protein KRT222 isoform X1 [Gouania willdenowi]XP_028308213.1 keratin-like protein KRT222 isoform X2 [Gouania willdenowi]XP_028308292.1 keratin-like protein KRT222 isoform X1 [Gouania willdenowi]XP_028308379.1 keratin-like protein KRT222 isoform X3 [Gouania willdenowi]XP_028308466.1 keratin-like protein KRT222 isoform X1 [Gouania wi
MDFLEDPSQTMWDLNARLKKFLQQVNQLQEANRHLEAQICEWGVRSSARSQDWSQQEQTVVELRAQVAKLLMENAELALQSDNMKARAADIQARCDSEEVNTRHLEQHLRLLRETKRTMDESSSRLQDECHRSMTELQYMDREFETAWALQLQWTSSCDALLDSPAAAARTEEEKEDNGTGMEIPRLRDRIRVRNEQQTRSPGWGERHHLFPDPPPGEGGPVRETAGGASRSQRRGLSEEEAAAWTQVSLGGAALLEARAELAEARKQWSCLQVEMETLHALEKGLENSLQHTKRTFSSQLHDLSQVIAELEAELEQVRCGLANQRQRHGQLLNTKMRLEREIATYRRLLEQEEGRYMVRVEQPMVLQPWRSPAVEPKDNEENGFSDSVSVVTPDEPKSEPLPEIPSLFPAENERRKKGKLYRQQSLVILTEQDLDLPISTVKTQEILQGHVVHESAEGHGTIETEKIDKVIKQWEGSFFKDNPKLRKKSVSLRFDLHMATADEGCPQTRQDSLPDVEVRLIMKRSSSIPAITP